MSPRTAASPVLREFLGRVRPHLPLREGNDILLELESTVLDRAETLAARAGRPADEAAIREALEEIGDPEEFAWTFAQPRYLVAPEAYRTFLIWTGMIFVVHLVLIGVATALARPLHVGLCEIAPVGANGLVSVLASAVNAVLLDVGITATLFGVAGSYQRAVEPGASSFAVDVAPRAALGRAFLALLVALVLNVFHDRLFVVISGGEAHGLVTTWTLATLPLLTSLLVLAAAKEGLYAWLGETRTTVAADAAHGVLGVIITLYLLGGDALLALPQIAALEAFREPVNAFLAQVGQLMIAVAALCFGVKTLRRSVRFAQL
mgnify:CR=1 FL=1